MVVAGTRPEVIKLAPVLEWMERLGLDYVFVWSGQHYDYEMSRVFFEQLGLREPHVDLDVRSGSHAEQTARIMVGLEKVIDSYRPSVVAALGDTNTVVAAALTAAKKFVPFAHIEAGLRSWDRAMPEEVNRIVADALAELHFAPTELAAVNLMHEGVPLRKIYITGNTIVDVVHKYLEKARAEGERLLSELGLEERGFILATVHRQENTDNPERLGNIVKALVELSKRYTIVFPVHPRTVKRLAEFGLLDELRSGNVRLLQPLGYFQFLGLLSKSLIVLTDSGGVQEEACTLRVPTLTLRYNTERPETVLLGINKVVGVEWRRVVEEALRVTEMRDEIVKSVEGKPNPLGDGRAGERIAQILKRRLEEGISVESADTRSDAYIIYRLTSADHASNNDLPGDVVAMYDGRGLPVTDRSRARMLVVRGPLRRVLGLDQGPPDT